MISKIDDDAIDFVILWVDGSDPERIKLKNKYLAESKERLAPESHERARDNDFDTLRYLLRSIEEYAPWVNKIFLVTSGQKPHWFNGKNDKIRLIADKDFFADTSHLPTFNSNAIQFNFHRIEELSEKFVLFDDDMIIMRAVLPKTFFRRNLPVHSMIIDHYTLDEPLRFWDQTNRDGISKLITASEKNLIHKDNIIRGYWNTQILSNVYLLYKNFRGLLEILKTLVVRQKMVTFFKYSHGPLPLLKSKNTYMETLLPEEFKNTSSHRFRDITDLQLWHINQFYYQQCFFIPGKIRNKYLPLNAAMAKKIACKLTHLKGKVDFICINDETKNDPGAHEIQKIISPALEKLFPDKSSFEK